MKVSKNYFFKFCLAACMFVFMSAWAAAQTLTITGTVNDTQGETLPGVNVRVQGTALGTVTDLNGRYSINVPGEAAVLHFSFVGYTPQEIVIGNQRIVNVTMQEDVAQIDEVVVVGYGVMRKSDVTGAVLSVTEAQLKDRSVTNAMEALQGKAAGVDITNNVRPGELGTIRIRGERSITGGNNPLYVVDGIPMFGRNNVNSINTQDIKSIDILKDASATAIYGSRGANGVILITTNAGEEGRFSVNYNGSLSFSKYMDSADRYDAGEWVDVVRWANYYYNTSNRRGDDPTRESDMTYFTNDAIARENVMKGWEGGSWNPSKLTTTDWTKFVIRTGVTQNHTLSVSGGTSKVRTYASVGYMDDKGTSLGQRFKRYTLNLNTTAKPIDWFELGGRLNGSWSDQEYGLDTGQSPSINANSGSILESAIRLYPHALPYDNDGNKIIMPGGDNRRRTVVDEYKLSDNQRQMLNVMANVYAQVKLPLDGLSYRVEFGPSFRYRRNGILVLEGSQARDGASGSWASLRNQRDFVWTVNNMLLYNKTFDVHSVNFTLLQTASKTSEVDDSITAEGDIYQPSRWNAFDNGQIGAGMIKGVSSGLSEEQLTSYMARVNYGFNNRYLLTVSGRWDGSSVLAEGHKWSFFPSASLAWRMDQEDFLKTIPAINQLKMRLGYGVTGNAAVTRYSTKGTITEKYFAYGETMEPFYITYDRYYGSTSTGTNPTYMPNKDLGWERTGQWNLGIDFAVLKHRISGSLEFYQSKTTDLLLASAIPAQLGYLRTVANIGKTKNHGVELTLNTVNFRTQSGFEWETNTSIAWQKNEIVELSNGKEDEIAGATDTRLIGKPLGIYYNYKENGLWKEENAAEMKKFNDNGASFRPGKVRVKDVNEDDKIDPNDDRMYIGKTQPTWTVGMTNTWSYQGVELMIQIYGRLDYWTNGASINNNGYWVTRKVDYYTEANTNAKFQRPENSGAGGDQDTYSIALDYCKASFLNIRYITLGYRFPKNLINGWGGMQSLRIYAQCVNPGALYSACDFKNMDVNSSFWTRNFVFGINVGF